MNGSKWNSWFVLRSRFPLSFLMWREKRPASEDRSPFLRSTSQTTDRLREGCEGDGGPASDVTAVDWSRLIRPTALRPSGGVLTWRPLRCGPRPTNGPGPSDRERRWHVMERKQEVCVAYALPWGSDSSISRLVQEIFVTPLHRWSRNGFELLARDAHGKWRPFDHDWVQFPMRQIFVQPLQLSRIWNLERIKTKLFLVLHQHWA